MVKTKKVPISQNSTENAADAKNTVTTPTKDAEDNVIYVYRSKQTENIPSLSPECLALETYLRMRNIPYKYSNDKCIDKPHGEPIIQLNQKEYVGFDKILEALTTLPAPAPPVIEGEENAEPQPQQQNQYVTLAELTTPDQQSDCQAYVSSLADIVLSYCLYSQRFKNSTQHTDMDFLKRFKSGFQKIFKVGKEEDRLAKLKPEQIVDVVKDSLKALNNRMQRSGGTYFFGDELTKHDAILFAVLSQYWKEPPSANGSQSTPNFFDLTNLMESETDNKLVPYLENIKEKFWPDWKERCQQPAPPPSVTSPTKRGTFRKAKDQSVTTPTAQAGGDQSATTGKEQPANQEKAAVPLILNGTNGETTTDKILANGDEKQGKLTEETLVPLTNGVTEGSPLAEKPSNEIPPINSE